MKKFKGVFVFTFFLFCAIFMSANLYGADNFPRKVEIPRPSKEVLVSPLKGYATSISKGFQYFLFRPITFTAYDKASFSNVGGVNILIDGQYAGTTSFNKEDLGKFEISLIARDEPYHIKFVGSYPKCNLNITGCYDDIAFDLPVKGAEGEDNNEPIEINEGVDHLVKKKIKLTAKIYNMYETAVYNIYGNNKVEVKVFCQPGNNKCYEFLPKISFQLYKGDFFNPEAVEHLGESNNNGAIEVYPLINENKKYTLVASGYDLGMDQYVRTDYNQSKEDYIYTFHPMDFDLELSEHGAGDLPKFDVKKIKLDLTQHMLGEDGADKWVSYLVSGNYLNSKGGWKIRLKTLQPYPKYDKYIDTIEGNTGDKYYCLKITNEDAKDVKIVPLTECVLNESQCEGLPLYYWLDPPQPASAPLKSGKSVDICFVPDGMNWSFQIQ